MKLSLSFAILLGVIVMESPAVSAPSDSTPVPVILDTDMSSDCDDAGALALLNVFMNQGEAHLLACVANGRDQDLSSGAVIQAINVYYGHTSIPIGAYHGTKAVPTQSHYTKQVHQQFVPDFPHDDKLPAGVDVYRKMLASAADGSVVIVSVGFLQNLNDLLQSKPDAVSDLSGPDLVQKKVKELIIMGGNFPKTPTDFNLGMGGIGSISEVVVRTWPTRILFTSGAIGSALSLGQGLAATPPTNPVRLIYELFGDGKSYSALKNGRPSWDLTAAWLGVRGPGDLWDVVSGGYYKIDPANGGGEWIPDPAKNQGYIVPKMPASEVQKLIGAELVKAPQIEDHSTPK